MIQAFLLGVREGFEQPHDLRTGVTWDGDPNSVRSQAYDHGANLGQLLGRMFGRNA